MEFKRSAPSRSLLALVLAASLGFGGAGQAFSAAGQREAGRTAPEREDAGGKSSPRAIAGPASDRPADPADGGKGKTWLTIAIVGGIIAGILVAVLLLKKKRPPNPNATTTSSPTSTVATTTSVPVTTTTSAATTVSTTTTLSSTTTTILAETGSILVGSSPPGAKIELDGADTGRITPALLTGVPAGSRALRLTFSRYQAWQSAVTVAKDQTATVDAVLQAGDFREDFNGGTAAFWQPVRGSWTVAGGAYAANAAPPVNFAASQYALGDYGDFTMEVRGQVFRPTGGSGRAHGILFRGTSDLGKYYVFHVNPGGASPLWDIFEITNDQVTRQYDPWQLTTLIGEGWNAIKIVARGSTFTFYVNGLLLGSRTIPEAPARGRIGLSYEVDVNGSDVQFDDVALSGSALSPPFLGTPGRAFLRRAGGG